MRLPIEKPAAGADETFGIPPEQGHHRHGPGRACINVPAGIVGDGWPAGVQIVVHFDPLRRPASNIFAAMVCHGAAPREKAATAG
ncbi:hypothetical protein XI04_08620 [Bradyrhizobium sp. CCBAU 11430]|nr:hypothetical protein [Bradyrhizobium sp. CCBAU 11430]